MFEDDSETESHVPIPTVREQGLEFPHLSCQFGFKLDWHHPHPTPQKQEFLRPIIVDNCAPAAQKFPVMVYEHEDFGVI